MLQYFILRLGVISATHSYQGFSIVITKVINVYYRAFNIYVGDAARAAWLGVDVIASRQGDGSQAAYQEATTASTSSTRSDGRFNIRDKIPFGLFSSGKESLRPRQTRRKVKKRVVRAT